MRHYETIYIMNPNLTDEDYHEVLEKNNNLLERQKAVIIKTKEWGKQGLAYTIKKCDKGSFILIEYCAEPGVTAALERNLKLDERVLKFQTVKLADNVDPQELLKKEEESKKEVVVEQEQPLEAGQAVQEETAPEMEVQDVG